MWQRLQYLWRGIGFTGTVKRIAARILSPIYRRQVVYIVVRDVTLQEPAGLRNRDEPDTECIVLEAPEDIRALRGDLPDSIPYDTLRRHLAARPANIVILAFRTHGARRECAGYRTCARGLVQILGLSGHVSSDILCAVHTEVLPPYRGTRVQQALRAATYEYCRRKGLRRICGFISTHNRPSVRAHTRHDEDRIVGTIQSRALLGNLVKRATPWKQVAEAIDGPAPREVVGSRGSRSAGSESAKAPDL
jgi:GNAT superfamily N-acetyltransferase